MLFSERGEDGRYANFGAALPALLFLTFLFFINFTSRVILSPLLPEIEMAFDLSHTQAGSIFLCMTAGYFCSVLFAGNVSSLISHKYSIILSTISTGIFLGLLGTYESLAALRTGLFLIGAGAGLYLPSGLATITSITPLSHLGRGMAVHEFAPNLGFVMAPVICTIIIQFGNWRHGMVVLGTILIIMGILFGVFGSQAGKQASRLSLKKVMHIASNVHFLVYLLLFCFAICSTLGIYSFLPLFLISEQAMDNASANHLVAFSRISSVFMPFLGGWAGDKIGHDRVMKYSLLFAGVFTVPIGFSHGAVLHFFVIVQPVIAVCFFPSLFAMLAEVGGREDVGSMVSVAVPVAFLTGGGLLPTLIGSIGDSYGLGTGITTVGICMIIVAAGAIAGLRKR